MAHLEKKRPVVLLTDFGEQDTFSGVLKGVIASISPASQIFDLTHNVDPHDILQGAFLLSTSCKYFPKGSVFCCVVDPGVGSSRKGICIKTRDYYFVGPDNGLLWKAANDNQIEHIVHLTNKTYFFDHVSNTFHGRDIFAPVAAHISKGLVQVSDLGEFLEKCTEYDFPQPQINGTDSPIELTVIHIDRFGNIILNIKEELFTRFVKNRRYRLTIKGYSIKNIFDNYSIAKEGEPFLIRSSFSYMEIAVKNASAACLLDVKRLDKALMDLY